MTPRGSLSCKTIIHATNAYASYLLPQLQDRIIPTRGQMFAVRAKTSLDRLEKHAWQANWGFEYWFPRPQETGEDEEYKPPLVMLGGGRDTAGPNLDQFTVDDSVLNGLVRKTLKDFLPNLYNETDLFEEGKDAEMEWVRLTVIKCWCLYDYDHVDGNHGVYWKWCASCGLARAFGRPVYSCWIYRPWDASSLCCVSFSVCVNFAGWS